MAYLKVDNISLRFPVFRGAGPSSFGRDAAGGGNDVRLIRDKSGRVTGVQALADVSFSAMKGDRIALIGRNGSGKSTLLQVLAGIIPPDSGRVEMSDRPTSLININLGMELEADGHRNIVLRGLAAGKSKREILDRQREIETFSGLGPFLDMPVGTLSAGMRMRLNFAIATAFNPKILLLDEWLSAGDAEFQKKAADRMKQFVDAAGVVILASHGRRLLEQVCNRCIWLDDGRVKICGNVGDVIDAYEAAMHGVAVGSRQRNPAASAST